MSKRLPVVTVEPIEGASDDDDDDNNRRKRPRVRPDATKYDTHTIPGLRSLREILDTKGATNVTITEGELGDTVYMTFRGQQYRATLGEGGCALSKPNPGFEGEYQPSFAWCNLSVGTLSLTELQGEPQVTDIQIVSITDADERGRGICTLMLMMALYSSLVYQQLRGVVLSTVVTVDILTMFARSATACYRNAAQLLGFLHTEVSRTRETPEEYEAARAAFIAQHPVLPIFRAYVSSLAFASPPWALNATTSSTTT